METRPTNQPEQREDLDSQIAFASTLVAAVKERNLFLQTQGGFDSFAEAGQHAEGMRAAYDALELAVTTARSEFDTRVANKRKVVEKLKELGQVDEAKLIAQMFQIGN